MALTPRKGDAASVRRQSRQRLRSDRRYTPYFGVCRFHGRLYGSEVRSRERHAAPLQWCTPFNDSRYELEVPFRDCTPRALPRASRSGRHVGLWPPRNDKSGTVIILSLPNTNRQHCAGPGCPLPYSALREAMGKTPLSTLNSRRPAGGYPRTGISSNPGRAPMPRRGSDCSRPDCAPRPPRATARCPAA